MLLMYKTFRFMINFISSSSARRTYFNLVLLLIEFSKLLRTLNFSKNAHILSKSKEDHILGFIHAFRSFLKSFSWMNFPGDNDYIFWIYYATCGFRTNLTSVLNSRALTSRNSRMVAHWGEGKLLASKLLTVDFFMWRSIFSEVTGSIPL